MQNIPIEDDVVLHAGSEFVAPDEQLAQQDPYRPFDWRLQLAHGLATNAAESAGHGDSVIGADGAIVV